MSAYWGIIIILLYSMIIKYILEKKMFIAADKKSKAMNLAEHLCLLMVSGYMLAIAVLRDDSVVIDYSEHLNFSMCWQILTGKIYMGLFGGEMANMLFRY